MSLILSEISRHGVAMAADSAVTIGDRVYTGAQKIIPVPQIAAGIGMWGNATVDGEDVDRWVSRHIQSSVDESMSLWELACYLADHLNRAFGGPLAVRMGMHVCGYDIHNGTRGPAMYHVHNGHYDVGMADGKIIEVPREDPSIREFRAHDDIRPVPNRTTWELRRNGDICVFAWMNIYLSRFFAEFQQATTFRFPCPDNLETRGEYLRFWISMTADMYRLSNARLPVVEMPLGAGDASIGGSVTVLTISESGIRGFYSR